MTNFSPLAGGEQHLECMQSRFVPDPPDDLAAIRNAKVTGLRAYENGWSGKNNSHG